MQKSNIAEAIDSSAIAAPCDYTAAALISRLHLYVRAFLCAFSYPSSGPLLALL